MSKENTIKVLKLLLKISVSSVALFFVFRSVNIRDVFNLLKNSDYWLLFPTLLLYLVSKYITAIRFKHFLKVININIPDAVNFRLYLLGMYYNLLLPGGVGGDGYKVYYLHKLFKSPLKNLLSLSIIDRVSGMVAILFLGEICAVFLFYNHPVFFYLSLFSLPATLAVYWGALYLFYKKYLTVFNKTNLQSLAGQILQVICILLLLMLVGVKQQYLPYVFIFLVSSIVAAFPFTIGGIGARELTFLYGAEHFNLDMSASVTVSMLFYLISAFSSLCGIYFGIFPEKVSAQESSEVSP
ncbi:MAG: flippase-like domain-containing protein [Sporocytophaga sp.]|uniref:lysylphosphatidylglycerol synthase transmembrane domain-containing protein n=1 Tax=Sporocytophaga sp. TaxID=2231183 RepID=UPI001B2DDF75|nr:lysylphosphatidylglycerol synthase transmembrane domain-containing protein [Sporocytophaga sp.]MBO9698620.1 flippase-like domain-containing protein [Sporocytophaga sp.]